MLQGWCLLRAQTPPSFGPSKGKWVLSLPQFLVNVGPILASKERWFHGSPRSKNDSISECVLKVNYSRSPNSEAAFAKQF